MKTILFNLYIERKKGKLNVGFKSSIMTNVYGLRSGAIPIALDAIDVSGWDFKLQKQL